MDLFNDFVNKVTEASKSALNKSKEILEVTKLNISIGDNEARVKKLLNDIGKIIYDAYKDGEVLSEEITDICIKIDESYDNIKKTKQKIAELRKIKICPDCKKENETDASYCSQCGYHFHEENIE